MKENKSKKGLASKIGATIILVIAAFAFIYVPAMTQDGSSTDADVIGKYNGKEIKNEYGSYYYSALQQAYAEAEANGQTITNDNFYQVMSSAFNTTVLNYACTEEVEKTGYIPAEAAISERIVQYISTQTEDPVAYIKGLSNSDKNLIIESFAKDLVFTKYLEDYFGNSYGLYGIKSTTAEKDFVTNMNVDQRSFKVASFAIDTLPESELKAFANNNADLFVKHNLSAITSTDEATLKTVLEQIKKNEITFEDAVKNYSTLRTTDANGKFQNNYKYQLKVIVSSEDDLNTVTNLKENELTDVLKVSTGYAIFRGDGENTPADFESEKALDTVNTYMNTYEKGLVEDYFLTKAEDFAADAISQNFEVLGEEYGATVTTTEPFPLNYNNNAMLSFVPSIDAFATASTSDLFFTTAFNLKENEISSPMLFGNYVVVLKMDSEVKADPTDGFSYDYYKSIFDQYAIQNAVLDSDKVENNVVDVYLKLLTQSFENSQANAQNQAEVTVEPEATNE